VISVIFEILVISVIFISLNQPVTRITRISRITRITREGAPGGSWQRRCLRSSPNPE
jgi:hypothetical protein